jgi:hypothetical protein
LRLRESARAREWGRETKRETERVRLRLRLRKRERERERERVRERGKQVLYPKGGVEIRPQGCIRVGCKRTLTRSKVVCICARACGCVFRARESGMHPGCL